MNSFLATSYAGVSVLTEAVRNSVSNGMLDLQATVTDVVGLAVPVVIGVIALTAGVNFAIGKVRSIASWAS